MASFKPKQSPLTSLLLSHSTCNKHWIKLFWDILSNEPSTWNSFIDIVSYFSAVICSLINIFDWAEVKKKKVEDGEVALIHEV